MRAQKTSKHLDIINRCHGDGLRLSQARARQFISVRALILCMHAVFVCARTCLYVANRRKKKISKKIAHCEDSQSFKGTKGEAGRCGVILRVPQK